MSDPNDIDARKAGPEATEAELLLIDLLYGELEGEAEAQARARIAGDESMARELETYGELRAMLRELPEEEPPQAVSARLLHVAAETAPRKRATALALDDDEPGLWSRILRFFQPLVSSPAVAAAAMLVLVAGVAGALYLGGNVEVAQPTAPSSPAPERPAAPAATPSETESGESAGEGRAATLSDELKADLGIAEEQQPPAVDVPVRPEPSARRPSKRPAEKELSKGERYQNVFDGKPSPEPAKPTVKAPPRSTSTTTTERNDTRGSVSGKAGSGGLIDADDDASGEATVAEDVESEAPAQQAPAPPPPTDQKKADKSQADAPATLHRRAVLAAADGECDAVRALAGQIRSADAAYYDKAVRIDKRLASCLTVKTKK